MTPQTGSNGKYMGRVEAGGRQREAASQLWNAMSQRADKRRCLYLHSLPVHVGPETVDYGHADGAEPQFGVADGSFVVQLEVVLGQQLLPFAGGGVGEPGVGVLFMSSL